MSMDIILSTNTNNPRLELGGITRFRDGSGFESHLVVVSGGFSAEHPFYFEEPVLASFVKALESMDQSLKGEDKLKPLFEDDYIELVMSSGGHVIVRGEMFECAEESQHLEFSFVTDQTCLTPLIGDLKKCSQMATT